MMPVVGGPDTPTVSGNGVTWVQIGSTVAAPGDDAGLSLFGAFAAGATTGVTTIDFAAGAQTHCVAEFLQVTGADESGTIANTVAQNPTSGGTATSGSVTLAAAADSNNRPIAGFYHIAKEVTAPRANWIEQDDFNGAGQNRGVESQYRTDAFETTASATWATSVDWVGVAAEIKVAAANVIVTVPVASLTTSLFVPTVTVSNNIVVTVPTASLLLSELVPVVGIAIDVPAAVLSTSTFSPAVLISNNISVVVPVAALATSTFAPTITTTANVTITVPVSSLTIVSFAPTVTAGNNISVTVPVAALSTAAFAPAISVSDNQTVTVPVASLSVSVFAPIITV